MNTFMFHNPTRLFFGKGVLEELRTMIPLYGPNVLLVYGGGSIKNNGIYDKVLAVLSELGCHVHELSGVESNPRLTTVQHGIDLCRAHNIDQILAVGGGSVIDCVKAISIGSKYNGNVWDIITKKSTGSAAMPFGTVLTLAATGSEMNSTSVITNWDTKEKVGWASPLVFPKFSLLDPEHTFTVSKEQTVYGIVDIMSHIMEGYFHNQVDTQIQDGFCETILRTMIDIGPKLLQEPTNNHYRETMMYCGTLALNGMLSMGVRGDWATHYIEHAVSAVYDIPHGGGLAILFPNWMRHVLDSHTAPRFKHFAIHVFGVNPAGKTDEEVAVQGIDALCAFWNSIGAPSRLADYEIGGEKLDMIAARAVTRDVIGQFKSLQREDVRAICTLSL